MNYQMPVKAIKNILKKELEDHKQGFYTAYPSFIMSDVMKEMIYKGHNIMMEMLELCTTHDELNDFISFAGYRMSLEDWINSL
jgi:hypothetical protein